MGNNICKHLFKLTIISVILIILGYLTMILMYASIRNTNAEGNYLLLFIYIFIVLMFFSMVAGSATMSIMNIQKINKDLKNKNLSKEIKRTYINMLAVNTISLVGAIMFIPIWSLFTK